MAYETQEWVTGQRITAEKLNYMEQGIANASGGGTSEPLIIHVTEEAIKDPQTQETIGFKTDVLASDAYEAWQSGRPIYYAKAEDIMWLVSSVNEHTATAIYEDDSTSSLKAETLRELTISDGYLTVLQESEGGDN